MRKRLALAIWALLWPYPRQDDETRVVDEPLLTDAGQIMLTLVTTAAALTLLALIASIAGTQ